MDCIYIAPYNLCLTFTQTFTHQRWLAAMEGTNQLIGGNWGLGVLVRDTSTRPGWDRTSNPPTARWQLLPPEPYRPNNNTINLYGFARTQRHFVIMWNNETYTLDVILQRKEASCSDEGLVFGIGDMAKIFYPDILYLNIDIKTGRGQNTSKPI